MGKLIEVISFSSLILLLIVWHPKLAKNRYANHACIEFNYRRIFISGVLVSSGIRNILAMRRFWLKKKRKLRLPLLLHHSNTWSLMKRLKHHLQWWMAILPTSFRSSATTTVRKWKTSANPVKRHASIDCESFEWRRPFLSSGSVRRKRTEHFRSRPRRPTWNAKDEARPLRNFT